MTDHRGSASIVNILYNEEEMRMKAVNYSHARNNFKSLIDSVCDEGEEIIITTKNDKSVVLISLDEYNRTHAQLRKRVAKSIEEADRGDVIDIDSAFEKAKKIYRD